MCVKKIFATFAISSIFLGGNSMNNSNVTENDIRRMAEDVFYAMSSRCTLQEMTMMRKAFELAHSAHSGQFRKSGEPYIIHPIAVAKIVGDEMKLGAEPVCAAFLHDVVEDTDYTDEDIEQMFNEDVAFLVRVVTKQKKNKYAMSKQLDNFKQMLDSMHYDVRAILIKLADRLHNMRTLSSMKPAKQMKIAGETDYFYAPLANRLGLYTIKIELENLSFKYRCPQVYQKIYDLIEKDKEQDKIRMASFSSKIDEVLQANGIRYRREIAYRAPYSLYRRMVQEKVDFEHLECRHFTRVVFPEDIYISEKNMCLNIYSYLTNCFRERPGSVVNYIDQPKQNGYQSFHVHLLSDYGVWEEVHVSSERMIRLSRLGCVADRRDSDINRWLENFRNVLRDIANNKAENSNGEMYFIESVRSQFYNDDIICYTPQGLALRLPKRSTVLDFAFNIHTEVGMHAKYAHVNGHLVSVKTVLHRGDCVEVGTDPDVWPQEDWRNSAKSYKALRHIHQYLDRREKPKYERCPHCHPVPGEEVIGFEDHEGNITVHRRDCSHAIALSSSDGDSIVAVDFLPDDNILYPASITIHAIDRQHLLSDLIDDISNKFHLSINDLHTVTEDQIVTCTVNFFVHSYTELQTIVASISAIENVDEVRYRNE